MGSKYKVTVAVVDIIDSRGLSGVRTGSTSGCGGKYCQKKCK